MYNALVSFIRVRGTHIQGKEDRGGAEGLEEAKCYRTGTGSMNITL